MVCEGFSLKVMCSQCGKILDLMISQTVAIDEPAHLTTYHFCSDDHMQEFARRKGMSLGKN